MQNTTYLGGADTWGVTIASVSIAPLYTKWQGLGANSKAMSIAFKHSFCWAPKRRACTDASRQAHQFIFPFIQSFLIILIELQFSRP